MRVKPYPVTEKGYETGTRLRHPDISRFNLLGSFFGQACTQGAMMDGHPRAPNARGVMHHTQLVPAQCHRLWGKSSLSPTTPAAADPGMIHSPAAAVDEPSLSDALGLETLEMAVKRADRPMVVDDNKSLSHPSTLDSAPRRGKAAMVETKKN